jgi:hypothetical protein
MDQHALHRIGPALATGALLLVGSCSLVFDHQVEQCKFDIDCNPDPSRAALRCERGLCVAPSGCERNSDCAWQPGEEAQLCVEARCQPLLGPNECFARFPREGALRDGALVLGAFAPQLSSARAIPELLNYELAVDELNASGGLPPNGRPLTLVVCDNGYRKPEQERTVIAGLHHLTRVLHVPGLVAGFTSAAALQRVFAQSTEAPALFVSPLSADLTVLRDDGGLIWYLLSPENDAPALLALFQLLAARRQSPDGGAPLRVVLWRGAEPSVSRLADRVGELLAQGGNDALVVDARAPTALERTIAARPELLLAIDSEAFLSHLPRLEQALASAPPLYVLPRQLSTSERLVAYLEATPDADAGRFLGVSPARAQTDVLLRYAERFSQRFPDHEGAIDGFNYYDAVYYLAYAAFAASPRGARALSADELRSGFKRLWQGELVEVGPAGQPSAYDALALGAGTIQLLGTLGPAAFDERTGIRRDGTSGVFCLLRERGKVSYRYDVFVYDADTASLVQADEPCAAWLAARE